MLATAMLVLANCGDDGDAAAAVGASRSISDETAVIFESNYTQAFVEAERLRDEAPAGRDQYAFSRSMAAQRRNIDAFVAIQRMAPDQDEQTITFLASGDALTAMHRKLAAYSMDPSNVADSLAMLYATAWQVVNDAPVSGQDVVALRHNATLVLSEDPKMVMHDDAQRQRAADFYLLLSGLLLHEQDRLRTRNMQHELDEFRQAVRKDWETKSGLDLASAVVAENGFVQRR